MLIANARLMLDAHKSDVPIQDLTPAEAVILAMNHGSYVGEYPITSISDIRDVDRKSIDEKRRLMTKYGKAIVKELFPGAMPVFPSSFEEAEDLSREYTSEGEGAEGGGADVTGAESHYKEALANRKGLKEVED